MAPVSEAAREASGPWAIRAARGPRALRRTVGPVIPHPVASPQSRTPLHRTATLYPHRQENWRRYLTRSEVAIRVTAPGGRGCRPVPRALIPARAPQDRRRGIAGVRSSALSPEVGPGTARGPTGAFRRPPPWPARGGTHPTPRGTGVLGDPLGWP